MHQYSFTLETNLCEPPLLALSDKTLKWSEDFDRKLAVIHKLAAEHGATIVDFKALASRRAFAGRLAWCLHT